MATKRMTKAQVTAELANLTQLDKKTITDVMDALTTLITQQLKGPETSGEFVVPGLVKLRVVEKPATEERQGINPHTREPMTIPAKPATRTVRATALKALKDTLQ